MTTIPDRVLLQMARAKKSTTNGVAELFLDIPSDRYIEGGQGWFEGQHHDDRVCLHIVSKANPATILKSFQDDEMQNADEKGWYMYDHGAGHSMIDINPIVDGLDVDPSQVAGGMQIKITAETGDNRVDTLRANITWGVR
jgi:hypothetical protein